MLALDMKTTVTIFVLVNYICAYMFALTWFQNKSRFKGLSFILFDFIFQSAGMTLAIFYGVLPVFLSIAAANILMFSGAVLFLFGIVRFLELKLNSVFYYIYLCVFLCLYILSIYSQPFFRIRILIFNGMLLLVFLHIVYLIFFTSKPEQRKHASSTGFAFVLFSILTAFRFYHAFAENNLTNYFDSTIIDNLLVVLSVLCTILLTFSLQIMVNKKLYSQVESLAITDPLTKAYNRRKIEEVMQHEIDRNSRYRSSLHVLLVDIDNFKHFNDTYGHDVGDKGLIHVTDILNKNTRKCDTVGRWGGEEFIIVLPNTNLQNAVATADKLVKSVNLKELDVRGESVNISISIGVAEYIEMSSFESVIRDADVALYTAKNNGRNRYELYV